MIPFHVVDLISFLQVTNHVLISILQFIDLWEIFIGELYLKFSQLILMSSFELINLICVYGCVIDDSLISGL